MLAIRAMRLLAVGAVLAVPACSGDDNDDGDGAGEPAGGAASELSFVSSDSFRFDPESATTEAGTVHIGHENDGGQVHTFVIEGTDFKLTNDDEGDVELEEGEYVFYCDVPGHRDAGMEGTITVTP